MSRASETIVPVKPRSPRNSPRTVGEKVAGSSGSSRGSSRCEVITASVPADTAARNGGRSRAATVAASSGTTGSVRWLSEEVEPWPGKCLAHAETPACCRPVTQAAVWRAATAGSAEKLRTPITGLSAAAFTSATGPRSRVTPRPASSAPIARAARRVATGSSTAPSTALPGDGLPVAACSRVTSPPSSSIATTSCPARPCARASSACNSSRGAVAAVPNRHRPPRPSPSRSATPASRAGRDSPGSRTAKARRCNSSISP